MSARKKITEKQCKTWLYAPQVSEKNSVYALGDPTGKWGDLMKDCSRYMKDYYNDFYEPQEILNYIDKMLTNDQIMTMKNMLDTIIERIKEAEEVDVIMMVLSSIILAFGLVFEKKKKQEIDETRHSVFLTTLQIFYLKAYEEAEKKVDSKLLINPSNILRLYDATFKDRPKNPLLGDLTLIQTLKSKVPEKDHPIHPSQQKCGISIEQDCSTAFEKITNWTFKPLARVLGCHCSFLKRKLKFTNETIDTSTLSTKKGYEQVTAGDFSIIQQSYCTRIYDVKRKPTIAIYKYKETLEESCDIKQNKTYLSQLFTKVCSLLYKPIIITPASNSETDIIAANLRNAQIAQYSTGAYTAGHLKVFQDPIHEHTITVFFIKEDGDVYIDPNEGPTKQFFNGLFSELLLHNVFIPTKTFFKNVRYILNLEIDIADFPFYQDLDPNLKTPEIKEKLTTYFYLYIGNLIHFAVANHIELPFKLSRIYIMQLFGMIDILNKNTLHTIFANMEIQLNLISLFLMERAPQEYTNAILKILQNPNVINRGHPDEDEEVFNTLTVYTKTFKEEAIMLNDPYTIVDDNRPLYSENEETMFYNMIDYLYKTALKYYFMDINADEPVNLDTLKPHPYLKAFFTGFNYYREYHEDDTKLKQLLKTTKYRELPLVQQLSFIRKLDVYLTGFGVTYESIVRMIPKIIYLLSTQYNTYEFLVNERDVGNYINTKIPKDLNDPNIVNFDVYERQFIYWLVRILLNQGRNISKNFVNQFNHRYYKTPLEDNLDNVKFAPDMTAEDYHNKFIELLLKSWTGRSSTTLQEPIKIHFNTSKGGYPSTYICFNTMTINKEYNSVFEVYEDLVILVTQGTNFGETLAGGAKKKKLKKKK
jgi:hypothetical protein